MDMSKTLSDLPMDLHRLILSHDEEKIELKKENEKLKTRVKILEANMCVSFAMRMTQTFFLVKGTFMTH